MATEAGCKLGDLPPVAELVECGVVEAAAPATLSVDLSLPPAPSPVQRAQAATLTQTGADPPPVSDR